MSRRPASIIAVIAALFIFHPASAAEADLVLEHVNIIPMTGEIVLKDQSIAVRDGVIIAIGDAVSTGGYASARRVDGQGLYVMPGLSDMHVHLRMPPQDFFDLNLAAGVTTVFNMGIADGKGQYDHVELRDGIAAGRIEGPRYLVSGPQLDGNNLKSIADVDAVLKEHSERGYDTIKIHGDLKPDVYDAVIAGADKRGFRVTGHAQHFMPLAQTLRMDMVEHVEELLYTSRDSTFAEEAGGGLDAYLMAYYRNLARLEDDRYRAGVVEEIRASGIWWDPTLIIYAMIPVYVSDDLFGDLSRDPRLKYLPQRVRAESLDKDRNEYRAGLAPVFSNFLAKAGDTSGLKAHFARSTNVMKRLTDELHAAGVPLLVGSDAFGALVPGFATHQELEMLVAAGLTPYEALQAATVNPAHYLGEADRAGTLEVGKRADFILIGGNPLADIRNAADVRGVFTHGRWHSASDLEARLLRVERHAAGQ